MRYPEAARQDLVESLHGRAVADPYRWLEDESSPATMAWQAAQDGLFGAQRERWSQRPALGELLREMTPGLVSSPAVRGSREFFHRREAGQEHAVYWVREADGEERPLVDPTRLDPGLTTVLDAAEPSKEGDRLAYLLSGGGREESSLYVMEVDTGRILEGPVMLGRGGAVAWRPGGEELFYVRRLPDDQLPPGEEQFHRRVWRHRVGDDGSGDELIFGQGRDRTTYYGLATSLDGRWLVVSAALGTAPRNDVYLLDTTRNSWSIVQEGEDWETWAFVHTDQRLYLLTNREAPRWKLCVTDPEDPSPVGWWDLLAETDDVLTDLAVTAEAIVAVRTRDVVSCVSVHNRLTGQVEGEVVLPGLGVADVAGRPEGGDEVWIGYTDYSRPRLVLEHRLSTGTTDTWALPPGAVPLHAQTRRFFVTSTDGTRVPLFVVARSGGSELLVRPTILYGYGGFNVSLPPSYSSLFGTWVRAGGVIAVANLRGGSEYGEDWHRRGMRESKQNVFDDFLAAARWLVEEGWSDAEHLGIFGGSNGGLLVGAALTQQPELFRAAVCSAPLLDMVRYERFGLGRTWNDEYGTAESADELGWLLSYSPYHRVRPGTDYPAVLFTVFEGDTRVDPLHARKMCAALQAATGAPLGDRPVLLRRERDVGHGARSVSRSIDLQADELAFLAHHLGLELGGGTDVPPGAASA